MRQRIQDGVDAEGVASRTDGHEVFRTVAFAFPRIAEIIFVAELRPLLRGHLYQHRFSFVTIRLVTEAAYRTTPEDVQKLRDAGWSENQISEAVYITALFAFFNRVADAFGVPSQNYLALGKMTP